MSARPGGRRIDAAAYVRALITVGVVCASFAAVASWIVLSMYWSGAFTESRMFGVFMLVKAVAFTALAVGLVVELFRRTRLRAHSDREPCAEQPIVESFRWELAGIVILSALVFLPNLHRFPLAAPDELHHLIVARNLATHGAYASGLAPDQLVHFDHYDSVGAPVIGVVAESFRLLGVDLGTGRIPMALYAIVFPVSVYILFLPWGRASATLAALATLGAFGTVYLGRTLYGEVPALTFFILGLVVWRRALSKSSLAFAFAAGLLFGVAVLTKTFLAISALAFLGAWLLDRTASGRMTRRVLAATACGGIAPLALWSLVEFSLRDLIGDQPSTLLYYRHMLTVGFEPLFEEPGRIFEILPPLLLTIGMLLFVVPRVFQASIDPALAVLFLIAPLFAFWWVGFTPMHIPRYLWYTAAIGAAFGGAGLGRVLIMTRVTPVPRLRVASGLLTASLLFGYGLPLASSLVRVYTVDQASDDRALVEYVRDVPESTPLATSYWPVERLISFELERPVEPAPELSEAFRGIFIESERIHTSAEDEMRRNYLRFGHYRVYEDADILPNHLARRNGD